MKNTPYLTYVCFLAFSCLCCTEAKVVVFFPIPGTSHIRYHTNIARAAGELGHEPWVCIPAFIKNTGQVDISGINVLYYGEDLGDFVEKVREKSDVHNSYWRNESFSLLSIFKVGFVADEYAVSILKSGMADKIKNVNPDLIVFDAVPFLRALYVIPYKLDIPYAFVGTSHDMVSYRVPFSPASSPLQIGIMNDRMDFWERLGNLISIVMTQFMFIFVDTDSVSMFAPEKPHKTLSEILVGAEVFILELDPIMDYPKPMLPNTKLIGGTAAKIAKPLKEPFNRFMESSNKGIIVISFGTSIVHLPNYIYNKIQSVAKASGLNVVWRSDQPSSDPERFLLSDWLPQNDILGHPNTKMFISHCGKNGQYEALFHGVPILCLPIFGDQPYNAERIRSKGYGLKADMRFATTEELTGMVQELITNTTYKNNMVKASKLFRLLYKSPMKEAAFWLDHVMEYGGDYMRASSQRMPLYQYLMLDILSVMCVVVLVVIFVFFLIIRSCVRLICGSKKVKSKYD